MGTEGQDAFGDQDALVVARRWLAKVKQQRLDESLLRWDPQLEEPSTDFLFQPDTCHPAHEGQAEIARKLMSRGMRDFMLVKESIDNIFRAPGRPTYPESTVSKHIEAFHVRLAFGLAPYVGRPFLYAWNVAVDRAERWIAGPTEIHYLGGE